MSTVISLSTYKSYKGITSTTNDTKLTAIIGSVNKYINEYCGRTFTDYYATTKTEYFDGANSKEIFPTEFPIRDITTLSISTDGGVTFEDLTANTDYFLDLSFDRIVAANNTFVVSNNPINSLKLVYRGGYATMPEDLVLAAVSLIEYYQDEQYTPRKSMSGTTVENTLYTADTPRLPPHIRRILDYYRVFNV